MNANRGFTLIELVMVVILISILAAVSLPMLMAGFQAFGQQREAAAVEREAMLALDRMSREVRIGREFVAAGSTLSFERDGAPVAIALVGSDLLLDRGGSQSVLARNVGSASFSTETVDEACYVVAAFSTAGVPAAWRSITYARNSSCDD